MGFHLPKSARKYFENVSSWDRATEDAALKLRFDMYYLALMAGFVYGQIADDKKDIEETELVDEYPQQYYGDRAPVFAGLLIEAEMDRKGIAPEDRQSLQGLMLEMLDSRSSTLLSKTGQSFLDQYAAGGMRMIEDAIPKPGDLGVFLVDYRRLINSKKPALVAEA